MPGNQSIRSYHSTTIAGSLGQPTLQSRAHTHQYLDTQQHATMAGLVLLCSSISLVFLPRVLEGFATSGPGKAVVPPASYDRGSQRSRLPTPLVTVLPLVTVRAREFALFAGKIGTLWYFLVFRAGWASPANHSRVGIPLNSALTSPTRIETRAGFLFGPALSVPGYQAKKQRGFITALQLCTQPKTNHHS